MGINYPDFLNAPSAESPWKNMLENVLKGYKMGKEPAKMAEEQKQRELANQLKQLDVEHKPKQYDLDDKGKSLANAMHEKALEYYDEKYDQDKRYKEAQINNLNQPKTLKGALATAFQIRNNLDPESPTYEKDVSRVNRYIDNLGRTKGQLENMNPGEGVQIDLPEGKKGFIPGVGNVKKGWQVVKDSEGKDVGVNVPMTDKQVEQWKAKEKFDVIYPFLNDSFSEYTGKGSWEKFLNDVKNYKTDATSKKRVDNFLAAKKLLSIGTTTENARIGGHATNVQLRELKNTLDSSEVNKRLEKSSGFALPGKYAQDSGNIFKKYLDKVESTAKTNIPAYEFRALNPQENQKTNIDNDQGNFPEIIETVKGITTIKHNGKTYKIPENLVDKFVLENTPDLLGGKYD